MGGPERVSVVVPCRDAARWIGEALDSILSQSRPPDEILVVDDGSSDDSPAVVRAFGSHVRWHGQSPAGISAARNAGVALTSGTLVAFLDADDLWPSDSLRLRTELLAARPRIDCAYGWIDPFLDARALATCDRALADPGGPRPGRLAGALLVRRHAFERVGPFDPSYRLGETMDWVARFEALGLQAAEVDAVVLRRRVHGANTVIRQKAMQGDYLRVLRSAVARRRETTSAVPMASEAAQ